ncbi:MAG: GAF domain-containing protein [Haloarculaceae archaeon]
MRGGDVLVVDPDDDDRRETTELLDDAGLDVQSASTIEEGLAHLDEVAVLVTAYGFPDGTGLELVRAARERTPDVACIVFAAETLAEMDTDHAEGEVVDYLSKETSGVEELLVDLVTHSVEERTQTAYPHPEDERERLAAVERYESVAETAGAALDRLAQLACATLDVSMASVGVVDEREQRILGCHGVAIDAVDREQSVCTYAILDDEVTVVEDLRDDPRFADNGLLDRSGLRFYASANLTTPDGFVVGTFCVYDGEPRSFSAADRDHLRSLAAEAMDQLELRRRLREGGDTDG